jgi:anti-sigma regulatory factor (Ser/Thr protein kinase)
MFTDQPRARSTEALGGGPDPERKIFAGDGLRHTGPGLEQAPRRGASRPARAEESGRGASRPARAQESGRGASRPAQAEETGRGASRPARAEETGHNASVRRASWALPPQVSSVAEGRRLVCAQLADWGLHEQSDVALLLVSELLTNALRHAWGEPILTLTNHGDTLRCEVEDENPTLPPTARRVCSADDIAEAGRGLHLVELLSGSWGSNGSSAGKVVWFELAAQPMRHALNDHPRSGPSS